MSRSARLPRACWTGSADSSRRYSTKGRALYRVRPFFVFDLRPMPTSRIHPATRLLIWVSLLIAVQFLEGAALVAALAIVPFLGRRVVSRAWRLIWRARWLLVSLFVVFAWGVPGRAFLAEGLLAPTHEGIREGGLHLGRMLLVLTAVAAFLEFTPLADLLAATRVLLRPFKRVGINADRGVVRLMLVLRYVETLPRPRDWKILLGMPDVCTSETVEVEHQALGWRDGLIIAGLCAAVIGACFW